MTIDSALATATAFEVASYVFLGLLVVAEVAALMIKRERPKHRAEVAGILSLALLFGADVGHSGYQHRADRMLRQDAEHERKRAEEAIAKTSAMTTEHERQITDARKSLEAAQRAITDDKTQIAGLIARVTQTEHRMDVIQTLEVDVEVIVETVPRAVAVPNSSFDPPTFVALIGTDGKQYLFSTQNVRSQQTKPTEYHVAFPFTAVPQNGLVGQPISVLKGVTAFACNVSPYLSELKNEITDGLGTLKMVVVVNGVALPLPDARAPSKMLADPKGGTASIARDMAQIPNRYRAAIESAHGRR
jgi:hypothetical protein